MKLGVPLYVHPAVDPESWQSVEDHANEIDWLVVNAADGPGSLPDGVLGAAIRRVRDAGISVLGYVDGAYGRRSQLDLLEDQHRWRSWYDVAGIFIDQLPSDRVPWVQEAVRGLRGAGATRVVANPGNAIGAEAADWFDAVVVFEGTTDQHRALGRQASGREALPQGTCHLVYGVSRGHVGETVTRAFSAGASVIWVTGSAAANPYGGVPEYLRELVARTRSVAEEPRGSDQHERK